MILFAATSFSVLVLLIFKKLLDVVCRFGFAPFSISFLIKRANPLEAAK